MGVFLRTGEYFPILGLYHKYVIIFLKGHRNYDQISPSRNQSNKKDLKFYTLSLAVVPFSRLIYIFLTVLITFKHPARYLVFTCHS